VPLPAIKPTHLGRRHLFLLPLKVFEDTGGFWFSSLPVCAPSLMSGASNLRQPGAEVRKQLPMAGHFF
jgi:hypothetical protein